MKEVHEQSTSLITALSGASKRCPCSRSVVIPEVSLYVLQWDGTLLWAWKFCRYSRIVVISAVVISEVDCTGKPVTTVHPLVPAKAVFRNRWSLVRGLHCVTIYGSHSHSHSHSRWGLIGNFYFHCYQVRPNFPCAALTSPQRTKQFCPQIEYGSHYDMYVKTQPIQFPRTCAIPFLF